MNHDEQINHERTLAVRIISKTVVTEDRGDAMKGKRAVEKCGGQKQSKVKGCTEKEKLPEETGMERPEKWKGNLESVLSWDLEKEALKERE